MPDLRVVLDREARTVHAEPTAYSAVMRRAGRRRRVRTVGTIAVALAVAAAGVGVALRGFGPAPSRPASVPESGLDRPSGAIWPELTSTDLERAQEQAEQGEGAWRFSAMETARQFAVEVLGWRPEDILVRGRGPSAQLFNPALESRLGAPDSTRTLLAVRQLSEQGARGIWSVVYVTGNVSVRPYESTVSVPGGTTIVQRASLSPSAARVTSAARVDLFIGPYVGETRPWQTEVVDVRDGRYVATLGPIPEGAGGWALVLHRGLTADGETIWASARAFGPYEFDVGQILSEDRRVPDRVADTRLRTLESVVAVLGQLGPNMSPHISAEESRRLGLERLREQMASEDFRYGQDETGDPIEYWEQLESEGIPVFEILGRVLSTPFAQEGDVYFWPNSSRKPLNQITDEDLRLLLDYGILTREEVDEWFATGEYPGWRAEIRADGTWLAFLDEKP